MEMGSFESSSRFGIGPWSELFVLHMDILMQYIANVIFNSDVHNSKYYRSEHRSRDGSISNRIMATLFLSVKREVCELGFDWSDTNGEKERKKEIKNHFFFRPNRSDLQRQIRRTYARNL